MLELQPLVSKVAPVQRTVQDKGRKAQRHTVQDKGKIRAGRLKGTWCRTRA